ncbi:MAG: UDP-N-acetylmuramate--L-alanine ligase [Candidatus Omnitrophica bacterium]|nr:UDP-N-acetylmuramate--L-alanine ligase [Candidatus Omnitrophota bacterium]
MRLLTDEEKQYLEGLFISPKNIYLTGIGGVGMSALAKVLVHLGHHVTGSDAKQSPYLDSLIEKGVKITFNQKEPDLAGIDFVIYSSAISENHPEMIAARRFNVPLFHRAHILSFILNRHTSIAVTGTHGKTTTSAMISFLLSELGANPTCLVGSKMLNAGDNVILGDRRIFVAEVDESDGTQAYYTPTYSVMTNLDDDHMDYYQTLERLIESFESLAQKTHEAGSVVYSYEDDKLRAMMKNINRLKISYGFSKEADFYAESIVQDGFQISFRMFHQGKFLTDITLAIPGRHNVLNSLGSIALLYSLGYDINRLRKAILKFQGTSRRLEVKFNSPKLMVIDDYAHHPTEVLASLAAIKRLGRKMCVIFQPHRFTRTKYLAKAFGAAFDLAEQVILTDVYSAGEKSISEVDANLIYTEVKASKHPNVQMMPRNQIIDFLLRDSQNYELVAFLGAGDIGDLANDFAGRVEDRA